MPAGRCSLCQNLSFKKLVMIILFWCNGTDKKDSLCQTKKKHENLRVMLEVGNEPFLFSTLSPPSGNFFSFGVMQTFISM